MHAGLARYIKCQQELEYTRRSSQDKILGLMLILAVYFHAFVDLGHGVIFRGLGTWGFDPPFCSVRPCVNVLQIALVSCIHILDPHLLGQITYWLRNGLILG